MKTVTLTAKNKKTKRIALNKTIRIELKSQGEYTVILSDAITDDDLEITCLSRLVKGSTIIVIKPMEMFFMPKEIFIPKSFQLVWHNIDCVVIYDLH